MSKSLLISKILFRFNCFFLNKKIYGICLCVANFKRLFSILKTGSDLWHIRFFAASNRPCNLFEASNRQKIYPTQTICIVQPAKKILYPFCNDILAF